MSEEKKSKPPVREIQLTGFGNIGDGTISKIIFAAVVLFAGEPSLMDCIKFWLTNGACPLP